MRMLASQSRSQDWSLVKGEVSLGQGPGQSEAVTNKAPGILCLLEMLRLGYPTQTHGAGPAPQAGQGWEPRAHRVRSYLRMGSWVPERKI